MLGVDLVREIVARKERGEGGKRIARDQAPRVAQREHEQIELAAAETAGIIRDLDCRGTGASNLPSGTQSLSVGTFLSSQEPPLGAALGTTIASTGRR